MNEIIYTAGYDYRFYDLCLIFRLTNSRKAKKLIEKILKKKYKTGRIYTLSDISIIREHFNRDNKKEKIEIPKEKKIIIKKKYCKNCKKWLKRKNGWGRCLDGKKITYYNLECDI